MNSQQTKRSLLGLLISLLVHGSILGALFWNWHTPSEAASNAPGEISTTISMEMIQGMRMEEPAPEPEPEPQQAEPEPEKQEVVADPTKKPEPEKKKEPEKKPEKPIEKPKPKPKEKPKEKPKNEVKAEKAVEMPKNLPIGDKNVNSTATANSKATTTGQPGTNGIQGGSGANTDEHNAYRAAIRREIERHKRYPARAKMMRKQGIVNVSFSVGADGSLSGERVTKSSGDESLDNAALEAVRNGENPELTTRQKHTRECFVVLEDGADAAKVEETIKNMPNYFSDYDTTVHFISEEELKANHSGIPHGGFVIRSGKTGWNQENSHVIEYSLKLDSNPEFTSCVIVAYARAAYRLYKEGQNGCKTVFDIAPAYLSAKDGAELRKNLL